MAKLNKPALANWYPFQVQTAKVAELVDALDLGSSGATRGSSSLPFRTTGPLQPTPDDNEISTG